MKFKVILNSGVTMIYSTFEQAQLVAEGLRKTLGYGGAIVMAESAKYVKTIKEVFDADDLEAAFEIIEEACKGCPKCINSYGWAMRVKAFFAKKAKLSQYIPLKYAMDV